MIDFRMNTFLAVCSCMNYTKAASQLNITQPAVTQHIKFLENYYHTQLFLHEGKKIRLSNSGEILFRAAAAYKNDEQYVENLIAAGNTVNMPLKFGTTMTIGEFVIGKPLSRYIKSHLDSDITMVLSNTSDLLNRLKEGEINFALVEGYFDREEYAYQIYSSEEFIPVCSGSHVFDKKPQALRDLLNEHIIVREPGSGTRDIMEKHLEAKNLKIADFNHRIEISGMHTIINLVKDDCGITFLYKAAVEEELIKGSIRKIELNDFFITHDFTFIWNKGSIFEQDYRSIFEQLFCS